jgi:hypothetical protein
MVFHSTITATEKRVECIRPQNILQHGLAAGWGPHTGYDARGVGVSYGGSGTVTIRRPAAEQHSPFAISIGSCRCFKRLLPVAAEWQGRAATVALTTEAALGLSIGPSSGRYRMRARRNRVLRPALQRQPDMRRASVEPRPDPPNKPMAFQPSIMSVTPVPNAMPSRHGTGPNRLIGSSSPADWHVPAHAA